MANLGGGIIIFYADLLITDERRYGQRRAAVHLAIGSFGSSLDCRLDSEKSRLAYHPMVSYERQRDPN